MLMYKKFILEILADKISDCTKCDLYRNRINAVPGDGPVSAKMMFIGECPGRDEDEQGKPFVGPSGKLLSRFLKAIKVNRKDVFISNVARCRPPQNRNPTDEELKSCRWFLDQEIDIIKPKILVILGAVALKNLTGNLNASIMAVRGNWIKYKDIDLLPMLHPAFLLRQMTPENKKKVESDLVKLRDRYNSLN